MRQLMNYLRNLTTEKQDEIRILVGNSYLDLHFRNFHKCFNPYYNKFLEEVGKGYKEELKIILYNTLSAIKRMDKGIYLSRYNKTYSDFNKYNPDYIRVSWEKMKNLLSVLEDLGYVVNYSGYNDRVLRSSMSSCIVFTDKLINTFDKGLITKFASAGKREYAVVRENIDKVVTALRNIQGIQSKREEIKSIEDWLNTHTFRFVTHEKPVHLQRIWVSDFLKAGRIYFGELQCIKKDKRKLFKINGKGVSEYDYDSNHMNICAELEKVILPENFKPYEIDVSNLITCENPKQTRSILKMCCMFLLNSGTPEATLKKFWKKNIETITHALDDGDLKKAESNIFYKVSGLHNSGAIIKRLEDHNRYARNYFRLKGGCWAELQNIDSEIMMCVMKEMKNRGTPFLPYHDSIIVQSDCVDAEEVMKNAWKEVLGSNHNCKVSKKY